MIYVLHYSLQFIWTYDTIIIYVKYAKNLSQNLLRSAIWHDVEDDHELSEVNVPVVVGVVHAEDVAGESLHVRGWIALSHHVGEAGLGDSAVLVVA